MFNGSGTFQRVYNFVQDRLNGIKPDPARFDAEFKNLADGLSLCIARDGQSTVQNDIPWNGKKITGLGDAVNDTDALNRRTADARYIQSGGSSGTVTQNGSWEYSGYVKASGLIVPPVTTTGTGDAFQVAIAAYTAFKDGMVVCFKADRANGGAATLQVNTLAAKPLKTGSGATLPAGRLVQGGLYEAVYVASADAFQVTALDPFVSGGAGFSWAKNSGGSNTTLMSVDGSGNLTATGNLTAFSDKRLKEEIETIQGALAMVMQMRGVRYVRRGTGRREVGVVAQEVQAVVPEAVHDGDMLSVAYGNLVGVLIQAVKELAARVEALEAGE